MDDFGDSFVQPEVDPAADFLAREQNQLAGLEDELETSAPPPVTLSSAYNGLDDFVEVPSAAAFDANGLIDDDLTSAPASVPAPATVTPVFRQEREEPEKIKLWREEQKKRLEEKDAEEETKKQEMLKIAKKELEDWYKTHEEQISKTKAANRNAERALARGSEGAPEDGNEWARVSELCDFGPRRGRDVARLRSIVLQLKQSGVRPKYPPRTTKVA